MLPPELCARFPRLHEAQERLEAEHVLATGLDDELGVATRDWGDGMWSVRCGAVPNHDSANQVQGLDASQLHDLSRFTAWFDEVGAAMHLRVPAPQLPDQAGAILAAQGLALHELEAWMAAPVNELEINGLTSHDVREVRAEHELDAYWQAFREGWKLEDTATQRVAQAAMCPWPGPSNWRRYTAFINEEPAAEALLAVFDEVAYLAEASTVPRFRRRGLQRALIAQRVRDARQAGATVIFGGVNWGNASWSNMRAVGLREAFLSLVFRRPPK